MNIKTYIIDVFTDDTFKGNPAGVCILENDLSESLMQNIASELNLSETAFIKKIDGNKFSVRYFTPLTEIPFCGHATFGSATVLIRELELATVTLVTSSGLELYGEIKDDRTVMNFPVYEPVPITINPLIIEALGITKPVSYEYFEGISMLLIEVESVDLLKQMKPDHAKLLKASDTIQEVVVTARSNDEAFDFYSRCFCVWIGIDEDPVTGAAHCLLAPYWKKKLHKDHFKAYQCSKRGGYLNLEIVDSKTLQIKSNATIFLTGNINTQNLK